MRLLALSILCAAAAGCASGGDAQNADEALRSGRAPQGGMRITRVDPTTACTVVTASTLGGATLGRPRTRVVGSQITVSWRNVDVGSGRAEVVCRLDGAAHQIVSIKVGGVERLSAPQPY